MSSGDNCITNRPIQGNGRLQNVINNLETLSKNVTLGQQNNVKNIEEADRIIQSKIETKQDKIDENTELVLKSITGNEITTNKIDISGEIDAKQINLLEESSGSNPNEVATKKYVDSIDNSVEGPIQNLEDLPNTASGGEMRYSENILYICTGQDDNGAVWKQILLQNIN
jgi:hypothetical protein